MILDKPDLILFTNGYPFRGGEPFLESEITYLASEFSQVWVFPLELQNGELLATPENVHVVRPETGSAGRLRKTLTRHGLRILALFLNEFILSPRRWKYVTQFRYNLYRLIGLIHDAEKLASALKPLLAKADNRVYSYWFNDNVSRLLLMRWFGLKPDIITRVHLYDFEEEFNQRGYLPFRYTEMKAVRRVVPISAYARQYLMNKYPRAGNVTEVSRLGARNGTLNRGGEGDVIRLVTCSSLTWYKRPMWLVAFMRQFTGPVHWVHFGSGHMKDEFLSGAASLPDHVKLDFRGQVSNEEILHYYAENGVDVLLNLSSFEGIPYSMMEAIAAGIPIIGCQVCGVPEIVTPETGYLLPVDFDPSEQAPEVEKWIRDQARNEDYRQGVQRFAGQHYMADKNYPEFIKKYLN